METSQVAFIKGFVEKCASQGWEPNQISEALAVLQLTELSRDPDFMAGFAKQAGVMESLKQIGGQAKDWFGSQNNQTQGALAGAAAGGLGGLVTGGKHKLRNALLGALMGGGAGYGIGALATNARGKIPARAGVPDSLAPEVPSATTKPPALLAKPEAGAQNIGGNISAGAIAKEMADSPAKAVGEKLNKSKKAPDSELKKATQSGPLSAEEQTEVIRRITGAGK